MSLALLQTALLLPLQTTLNGLLALDAASPTRLAGLEGKTLAVHCTVPRLDLFISIGNGRLRLSPLHAGPATATLRGPGTALLRLLLQDATPVSLAPLGLELQGSTAFMQAFQTLLQDLDVDWQFHLGRLIGDLPVTALDQSLQTGQRLASDTLAAARSNVKDYLRHESGLFPARSAMQEFSAAVMALQLRLDRLDARLRQAASAPGPAADPA